MFLNMLCLQFCVHIAKCFYLFFFLLLLIVPQPEALPVDRRVSEDPLRRCCHKEPRFLNTCLHTSTFEQQRCHQLHIDKRSTIAPFSSHLNGSLNFAAAQTRPLIVFRRYAAANLPTPYGIIVQRICQTRIPMAVCRG